MQLPNGSSSQHAQSLSNTYGSPQNVARRLKVIDLMNISSTQHAQSTPYVTATGPSTQPVSHTPSSACTSNTDAMYSPTETEEQDPLSSTASYYTAEETSGLRQQHLELRCRGHHNARALGPAITLPFSYKPYDGKQSISGCSYYTNATNADPRQYNKRSQKFTSHQMVREGNSFTIPDRTKFARMLLPTLCSHGNFRAFCRLLWYYNFDLKKQTANGSSLLRSWQSTPFREYSNPNFRRDDETGPSRMECRRRKTKAPSDPGSRSSLFSRCSRARGESTMDEDHVASDMWRDGKPCESVPGSHSRYPKRRRVA